MERNIPQTSNVNIIENNLVMIVYRIYKLMIQLIVTPMMMTLICIQNVSHVYNLRHEIY